MRTKKEIKEKLDKVYGEHLAENIKKSSEKNQRKADYLRGYIDALEWVLK